MVEKLYDASARRTCAAYQIALDMEVTNETNQVFPESRALGLGIDHLGGYPTQRAVFEARDNLVQRGCCVTWIELGDHGRETCFERRLVCDHVLLLQESVSGEKFQWIQCVQRRGWYVAMRRKRPI